MDEKVRYTCMDKISRTLGILFNAVLSSAKDKRNMDRFTVGTEVMFQITGFSVHAQVLRRKKTYTNTHTIPPNTELTHMIIYRIYHSFSNYLRFLF